MQTFPIVVSTKNMIVEKKDGTLWMLTRTFDGIGESFSNDDGRTWTPGEKAILMVHAPGSISVGLNPADF